MAMFLGTGVRPVSAHRQHVGATILALLSQVNRNLRAHVGQGSGLPHRLTFSPRHRGGLALGLGFARPSSLRKGHVRREPLETSASATRGWRMENTAAALRQFIQKAHAMVRQRHFPRRRHLAANQAHIGDRVVRRPKGAGRHHRRALAGAAGDAVGMRAGLA